MPLITERYSALPEVRIEEQLCRKCLDCVKVCAGAPLFDDGGRVGIDHSRFWGCIACGQCMAVCPTGAVQVSGRDLAPADVFPLPPAAQRAGYEALWGRLAARRSVRRFQQREVESEVVQRILDAAALAPMGIPPTEVRALVVNGRDKVEKLAGELNAAFQRMKWITSSAGLAMMRVLAGAATARMLKNFFRPLLGFYDAEWQVGRDRILYHAPLALYFYAPEQADPADPVIAATLAMLAAESLGLGTCFIGLPGFAFQRDRALRARYGVQGKIHPGLLLIAGYPLVVWKQGVRRRFVEVRYA
jgi:nitroreductase/NAD-dependent dihydropyrimidine dehydrogenase PreA subunit